MKKKQFGWIVAALLIGMFVVAACGDSGADRLSAQPLTLATPASAAASEMAGLALPQQIVVVLVTPTPDQATNGQQNQDSQSQGQANQSGEAQAVAQAQSTPEAQNGEGGQGETSGDQQGEQGSGGEQNSQSDGGQSSGEQSGEQANEQELINMGEQVYSSNCASCHQPNGEGTSAYPALTGSARLTEEDPTNAINIVVNGSGQMPGFGEQLSAEEIAAVISYERNSWGNSAGVVTADQVSQVQEGGSAQASGGDTEGQQQGEQTQGEQSQEQQSQQPSQAQQSQSQVQVSQEQSGNVITIRIEVILITPESTGAAQAPSSGEANATPTPNAQQSPSTPVAEEGASEDAADSKPTTDAGQSTPMPQDGAAQATPTPEADQSQATATAESDSAESTATATPEDDSSGEAVSDEELLRRGEQIYGTSCANCHQLTGEGNTAYPPLNNSEIVTAEDPTAALLTILNGRGHMPGFAGTLSDEEIAAVLSHERSAWDNDASKVTVEQVRQAREGGQQNQNDEGAASSSKGAAQSQPTDEAQAGGVAAGDHTTQSQASSTTVTVGTGEGASSDVVIQIQIAVVTPASAEEMATPMAPSSGDEQSPSDVQPTPSPEAASPDAEPAADEVSEADLSTSAANVVRITPNQTAMASNLPTLQQLITMGQEFLATYCTVCAWANAQDHGKGIHSLSAYAAESKE